MISWTRIVDRQHLLTTPRAATVAGILAGVVFIAVHLLLRLNLPASPENTTGEWLLEKATSFDLALRLVPFGGLFLLWFIGVARDRLAEWEDKFFAKVFLSI